MLRVIHLTTMILILLSCNQSTTLNNLNNQAQSSTDSTLAHEIIPDSSIHLVSLFTLTDAEKILGEQAHLTDSSSLMKGEVFRYTCSYTANTKDLKSEKTGVIYYLIEKFARLSSAKEKYFYIKSANENHGINVLHDVGEEAYFHSDGQNFYFIMARKGSIVFNMKVNKITSNTSLDEFRRIAKKITDSL